MARYLVVARVGFVIEAESEEAAFKVADMLVNEAVNFTGEEDHAAGHLSSSIEDDNVGEGLEGEALSAAVEAALDKVGL